MVGDDSAAGEALALQAAQSAFTGLDFVRAAVLFGKYLEMKPKDAEALSMRAACYCMLSNWRAAAVDLEAAAVLRPCAVAHARVAEARVQLGDLAGARLALGAAKGAADAAECTELHSLEVQCKWRTDASEAPSKQPGLSQDRTQVPSM